ncbi:hypothetical protein [Streptomyces sp. NPDC059209]|uniref:hypothetical protein n=1 Tax=Streptomyces sp. NPDC059209 TaxID=3346769 RepID=UPI0036A921AD
MMLQAMPGTAVTGESRAQSRTTDSSAQPDLVQREGVRGQLCLPVHGRGGPDDVLGKPQQDERQLRVRSRPPGDSSTATHLQRQQVVEAELHLLGRQRGPGRDQVRHGGLLRRVAPR